MWGGHTALPVKKIKGIIRPEGLVRRKNVNSPQPSDVTAFSDDTLMLPSAMKLSFRSMIFKMNEN